MNKFNVRVEYEPIQIRHIAVQCPYCGSWYRGYDISDDSLAYGYKVSLATFLCPKCDCTFGHGTESVMDKMIEMDYPEIYNDVLEKQITWAKKG